MYRDFFKFRENPFHITPDPGFLFLSPSHKEASASIFYGIEQRKGFVAVTGEVGVGKTTILRSYLEGTDPEKIRIVYIFNATISFEKLLKQIASGLGVPGADEDPTELVESLFRYLIEEYKNDRNVVLIIDEAQNMPVETLERLRMLSNLETSQEKLLQIILVGQPEFEDKLNLPELRQLKQRIAIRCRIDALSPDESLAYIHHRLMKASLFHNPVFAKDALNCIVKKANGIPRIINVLCDNSLVTAFGYQCNPVDKKIVKEVIKDFQFGKQKSSFMRRFVRVSALIVFLGVIFLTSRSLLAPEGIPAFRTENAGSKAPAPSPATETAKQPEEAKPGRVETALHSNDLVHDDSNPTPREIALVSDEPEPPRPVSEVPATDRAESPLRSRGPAIESGAGIVHEKLSETETKVSIAPAQLAVQPQVATPVKDETPKKGSQGLVVRRGDSVRKLLMGAYGRADDDLIKAFKDLNPQIKNLNVILEGEQIVLPKSEPVKPRSVVK